MLGCWGIVIVVALSSKLKVHHNRSGQTLEAAERANPACWDLSRSFIMLALPIGLFSRPSSFFEDHLWIQALLTFTHVKFLIHAAIPQWKPRSLWGTDRLDVPPFPVALPPASMRQWSFVTATSIAIWAKECRTPWVTSRSKSPTLFRGLMPPT